MYVRIVTFALAGITDDDYHRHAAAVAEASPRGPACWARFGSATGTGTGTAVSTSSRPRPTPIARGRHRFSRAWPRIPAFIDLAIEEYETLPEATAVTLGSLGVR